MSIQTVGIIGAGTMGSGIAQACAVAGVSAVMVDISDAAVNKGRESIAGSLERLLKRDKISEADRQTALARIRGSMRRPTRCFKRGSLGERSGFPPPRE